MKIVNGWLVDGKHKASPNYNERPKGSETNLLVIHNISLPPSQFGNDYIEQFFLNELCPSEHPFFTEIADLQVSAHFLIKRTGEVVQFVSCEERAWHAGLSSFCGQDNCNDYSIGIELEGTDDIPYEDLQYVSLVSLTQAIQEAYPGISNERITGHSDIAPGRKTDPGPVFDWHRYLDKLS